MGAHPPSGLVRALRPPTPTKSEEGFDDLAVSYDGGNARTYACGADLRGDSLASCREKYAADLYRERAYDPHGILWHLRGRDTRSRRPVEQLECRAARRSDEALQS